MAEELRQSGVRAMCLFGGTSRSLPEERDGGAEMTNGENSGLERASGIAGGGSIVLVQLANGYIPLKCCPLLSS